MPSLRCNSTKELFWHSQSVSALFLWVVAPSGTVGRHQRFEETSVASSVKHWCLPTSLRRATTHEEDVDIYTTAIPIRREPQISLCVLTLFSDDPDSALPFYDWCHSQAFHSVDVLVIRSVDNESTNWGGAWTSQRRTELNVCFSDN